MMMKITLLAAALATLVAAPAFALTDIDIDAISPIGYVGEGETIEYDHFFSPYNDPSITITAIDSAWLFVGVIDLDAETEVAGIDLNSVAWQQGSATATVFFGNVTAQADLLNNNGMLTVSIEATEGDFNVAFSVLQTTYTFDVTGSTDGGGAGDPGSAMPEPSAALLFVVGALVVRSGARRRS